MFSELINDRKLGGKDACSAAPHHVSGNQQAQHFWALWERSEGLYSREICTALPVLGSE